MLVLGEALKNEKTLLVPPVARSTLNAFVVVPELWPMQATRAEEGKSAMARQKSASKVAARVDKVKTVPAIVSCHDLKSFVVAFLYTPSINESLRTPALVFVWPVVVDARRSISGVKTTVLIPPVSRIVHGYSSVEGGNAELFNGGTQKARIELADVSPENAILADTVTIDVAGYSD